jgi:hypothetical protein
MRKKYKKKKKKKKREDWIEKKKTSSLNESFIKNVSFFNMEGKGGSYFFIWKGYSEITVNKHVFWCYGKWKTKNII